MAYRQNDSQRRNGSVRFDLMEHIGVLSMKDNGWTREVNIVSWNDGAAKVDIREWDPEHKRMTKGVTLFEEEAETLTKILARRYGLRLTEKETVHRTFIKDESGLEHFKEDWMDGAASDRQAEPEYDTAGSGASAGEAAEEAAGLHDDPGAAPAMV